MKYIDWHDQFEACLSKLNREERERALAYYGEMYADMRDSGMSEEEIVAEFGSPCDAAKKIIDEEGAKQKADKHSAEDSADNEERAHFTSTGEVGAFDIDGALGKIYMRFYDGDCVKIDYPTTPFLDYKITERDGRVKIEHGNLKFRNMSFKANKVPDMFVNIPRSITPDCNIGIATGALELGEGNYGKIIACVRAGKLDAGKLNCTDAKFLTDAGKIEIESANCNKADFTINSGKLTVGHICGDALAFMINAGAAVIGQADSKHTDIMVNTGKANITMCGTMEEYDIAARKSFGSCNLQSRTANCERSIRAEVAMGSLNVSFKN